jgi:hypothetical protein
MKPKLHVVQLPVSGVKSSGCQLAPKKGAYRLSHQICLGFQHPVAGGGTCMKAGAERGLNPDGLTRFIDQLSSTGHQGKPGLLQGRPLPRKAVRRLQ